VAGALIGLLFVAISVSGERLARAEASSLMLRIRANAALTGFINALVVSLFALIPDGGIGTTSFVVAIVGLLFVAAALLQLIRVRHLRWATGRDALFLVGQAAVFIIQFVFGIELMQGPSNSGAANGVAILVVVCFGDRHLQSVGTDRRPLDRLYARARGPGARRGIVQER